MVPPHSSGYPEPHSGRQHCLRCNYRARHFFAPPVDGEFAEVCVPCYLVASIQTLLEGFQEESAPKEVALLLEEVYSILRARSTVRHWWRRNRNRAGARARQSRNRNRARARTH